MRGTAGEATAAAGDTVRVWDLPVRICHWSFVALLPALWWTAENGAMRWHMRLGTVLLALVLFRILWGFVGSSTARFASFLKDPAALGRHFRQLWDEEKPIGHNPAGGWSVALMLLALGAQVTLGLFSGDPFDGATGPLNDLVGARAAGTMTELHEILFNVILALVGLHVAAIAFHALALGDNLIGPMLGGSRPAKGIVGRMEAVPAWRAAACALVAGGAALWLYQGAPPL